MESKDITRHIIWALVISVGWWLVTWLLGMLGQLGGWITTILFFTFLFGLLFYAINGKGWMHGLIAGIIYAVVFIVVNIIVVILLKNPLANGVIYFFNYPSFAEMFKWDTGVYLPLVGFLLFTSFIGWANDHK